ncbi:MAG: hypothetical protein P4L44_13615 [Oryzomonas sp.]|uniref:hypothetical protein n=1 Tax=Oryzomonas sp. TaxID=2855186 RepID=UPI00284F5A2E|nr:hypothetical protein [Oryzomonas sp.]MDR3580993.1 hypothetical protein [Oryzomonas sp.]
MVTNGISGTASTPSVTTAPSDLTPATPGAATTPTAAKPETFQPKHDTVELTGTALAKSLKLAGQTPAQIALKMGLDVKTVNGYLGITTKATTATLPPPTTVAPQVKQSASGTATPATTKTSKG